jgi:hypothetical protein
MTFPWGHRILPFVWYAEACVAAAALWTLLGGGRARDALAAAAYLVLCGAAAGLPGSLLLGLMDKAGFQTGGRRLLLHVYLAVAAGAVAAFLGTGRGWSAAVAILMTANAIWTIEADARRTARVGSPQTPAPK